MLTMIIMTVVIAVFFGSLAGLVMISRDMYPEPEEDLGWLESLRGQSTGSTSVYIVRDRWDDDRGRGPARHRKPL